MIAAIANSNFVVLFKPGAEIGSGGHATRMRPEFIQQPVTVNYLLIALSRESNRLERSAITVINRLSGNNLKKYLMSVKSCRMMFPEKC